MMGTHDMDDMGEWVLGPVNLPGERSSFLALTLPREAVSNTITIDASTHAGLLRESLVEHAEIWRALS